MADNNNMLLKLLEPWKSFSLLKRNLIRDGNACAICGMDSDRLPMLLYAALNDSGRCCLLITENENNSRRYYEQLQELGADVLRFPPREIVYDTAWTVSRENSVERLKVLDRLTDKSGQYKNLIIISTIDSLISPLARPERFAESGMSIKVGDLYELDELAVELTKLGYKRTDYVSGNGQFTVRGSILDVFPIYSELAYRIEFFDIEVDSIRTFDADTQRSVTNVDSFRIIPTSEICPTEEELASAMKAVNKEFKARASAIKSKDADLASLMRENAQHLEQLYEEGMLTGDMLSAFTCYLSEHKSLITDYLPKNSIIMLDQPEALREYYQRTRLNADAELTRAMERGVAVPGQVKLLADFPDLADAIRHFTYVTYRLFDSREVDFPAVFTLNSKLRNVSHYGSRMTILASDIRDYFNQGMRVLLVVEKDSIGQKLADGLSEQELTIPWGSVERLPQPGKAAILIGNLSDGFELPDTNTVVIGSSNLFGSTAQKKRKTNDLRKKLNPFTDLSVGGYVVHERYGIGRYLGIEAQTVGGVTRDYLMIQYAGSDKLYLPADNVESIEPYVGVSDAAPKLSNINSGDWQRTKSRVRRSVRDMADELIKLYAEREMAKGFVYSPDTVWQHELEDDFPYNETEDQLNAIADIKRDMESGKVMDRLLCGDVGYGKTEVAMRALFKAVMDGKQAVLLAPTTVLAHQHFENVKSRMAQFPLNIACLSRLESSRVIRENLRRLKSGDIDILVGTHRVLSKDVIFKDLGLLVVDEEQRFGVAHKERIKQLKQNVDVLTLTATPIPRTLHMSLIGLRDVSVLEVPPENRRPVQTYVSEQNDSLMADAIRRELGRGGQVFFLYNRIGTMDFILNKLLRLVPEARIAVGHGQMNPTELEKVMEDFYKGEYDILLSTTIIENGIDVPNANTLIVYDSDRLGLAQLYQLKGRIGRSNRQAYAYLFYTMGKELNEEARKRLQAIKDYTQFGAGYRLAMRDLEIRGSGNILGTEQHGHMESVGYDLYCRMLKEEVDKLKGNMPEEKPEASISISINAAISSKYIEDPAKKLGIYKRIAAIKNNADYEDVLDELVDRFGEPPENTVNLLMVALLKALATELDIETVTFKEKAVDAVFRKPSVDMKILNTLAKQYVGRLGFKKADQPILRISKGKGGERAALTDCIQIFKTFFSLSEANLDHNNSD